VSFKQFVGRAIKIMEENQEISQELITSDTASSGHLEKTKLILDASPDAKNNNPNLCDDESLKDSSFYLFPTELLEKIFSYCTLYELYRLKLVCKLWQNTIQNLPKIELVRSYVLYLRESTLIRNLSTIINDEPLLPFIQGRLHPFRIPEDQQIDFTTISAFCARIEKDIAFIRYPFSYRQRLTSEYFSQQAQLILNYIAVYGQPKTEQIEKWFDFKWQYRDAFLMVFEAHLDLENKLSTMAFILQTSSLKKPMSLVSEICRLFTPYWPTSADLVALDIYLFRLLYNIIEQSINLHTYLQETQSSTEQADLERQKQYQERLRILDNLLKRVKFEDWLLFLDTDQIDLPFKPRALILSRALDIKHPAIPPELFGQVALILTKTQEKAPAWLWPYKRKTKRNAQIVSYFEADDEPSASEKALTMYLKGRDHKKYNEQLRKYLAELKNEDSEGDDDHEIIPIKINQQYGPLPLSPIPASGIPGVAVKPPTSFTSFNWLLALKIIGIILLGLIGLGLLFTGIGAFAGLSLLVLIPLIVKILLLTFGVICCTAFTYGCISSCLAAREQQHPAPILANPPQVAPDNRLLRNLPNKEQMNQLVKQPFLPNNEVQKDINQFNRSVSSRSYPPSFIQSYTLSSQNQVIDKITSPLPIDVPRVRSDLQGIDNLKCNSTRRSFH
jgi:hypothetical protein